MRHPILVLLAGLALAACSTRDRHPHEDRVHHHFPGGTVSTAPPPRLAVLEVSRDGERSWRPLAPDERPGKAIGVSWSAADHRGGAWIGVTANPGTPSRATYRVPQSALPDALFLQIRDAYPREIEVRWDEHGQITEAMTR